MRTAGRRIDVRVAVVAWALAWVVGQLAFQVVIAVSGESVDDLPIPTLAVGVLATWCAYLAGAWWASVRDGTGDFVRDHRLAFEARDLLAIPVGVLTQLVLVPLLYVPLRAVWSGTFTEDRLEETARDLVEGTGGSELVLLYVVVVVGAPLVEEIVYRGLLQGSFASRIDDRLAILAAAAWFALIHFRPIEYPGLFLAGVVFGACFVATGRLGTAIVAHAAFNATGLAMVATSGW